MTASGENAPLPAEVPPDARRALPGNGFLGWLGRQVGYVTKAMKTDVAQPKPVFRRATTEEQPHPADPTVILRRTTIDEVVTTMQNPNDETRSPNQ